MKFRKKLIITKLAVALIPLIIIIAIVLDEATDQSKELTIRAAQTLVSQTAEKFSGYLSTRKGEMGVYSTTPLLETMDWQEIAPYYQTELERYNGIYEKFLVGTPEGYFYNTATGNPYLGGLVSTDDDDSTATPKTITHRDYWQETCGNNTSGNHVVYVSNPMISMSTGVRQVMVAATILSDDGDVIGMTSGSLPWEQVEHQISLIKTDISETFGQQAKFALVAKNGEYFYHWNEDKVIHLEKNAKTGKNEIVTVNVTEEEVDEIAQAGKKMMAGQSGFTYYDSEDTGEKMLLFYSPVEAADYSMILTIPNSFIMKPIVTMRWWMALIAFIFALIITGSAIMLSNNLAKPITKTASVISSSANEIAVSVDEQERTANQQSSAVNETTTTMEELEISSQQTAEQSQLAAKEAAQVLELVEQGLVEVEQSKKAVSNLREKISAVGGQIIHLSEQINQISDVTLMVSDIANQVNLLALNASVEAARAGEQGKGFAVVATEIRKLADQSKKSAEKIDILVNDIQKATNSTVMATEEGNKTLERVEEIATKNAKTFSKISTSADSSSESVRAIILNIQQQAAAIRQVVEAMNSLNTGAKETASGIRQIKSGVDNLNDAADELKDMV